MCRRQSSSRCNSNRVCVWSCYVRRHVGDLVMCKWFSCWWCLLLPPVAHQANGLACVLVVGCCYLFSFGSCQKSSCHNRECSWPIFLWSWSIVLVRQPASCLDLLKPSLMTAALSCAVVSSVTRPSVPWRLVSRMAAQGTTCLALLDMANGMLT